MGAPAAFRPARDRALEALRSAGSDGVLRSDLRQLAGAGIGAHIESLRYEGFRIAEKGDTDRRGWSDTRYFLAHDPEAHGGRTIAEAPTTPPGSSAGGEPGSRLSDGSPARNFAEEPSEAAAQERSP